MDDILPEDVSCDLPMPEGGPRVIPAASVIVFRSPRQTAGFPEFLMVERSNRLRFAGGAAVFPGGRVDPEDRALAHRILPGQPMEMAAARIAAIRETLEETGLLLAARTRVSPEAVREARALLLEEGALAPVLERMGWELRPEALTFYAHWCPLKDKAFDTRFFLADIGTGDVDVTVDQTENTRLFWASAQETLARAAREEISVIFPTLRNLERLVQYTDFDEALADCAAHPPRRITPRIESRTDGEWLVIPSDLGYPVSEQAMATVRRG